jgi:DNA (cytosine-5)-methyltransferase 1
MNNPVVIDLFSGVGGLSLGASRAGFHVAGAFEIDKYAIATHSINFPHANHVQADIGSLTGKEILELSGLKQGMLDGLIGGPPCQGFSTMGKRDDTDPRNQLFYHFFRLIKETKPKFFIAENVPGILTEKYKVHVQTALDLVRKDYTLLDPIKVKADRYGAPTTRTRIFFIGFKSETLKYELSAEIFLPHPETSLVNVKSALEGLPTMIRADWQAEEQSWRKAQPHSDSEFHKAVNGNIPTGIGSAKAIELLFEKQLVSGCLGTRHIPEVVKRFARLKAGEVDAISKAKRLDPNGFCPTLRAGTGSDKGSFQAVRPIHMTAPRVITPREAARLQGFPDWFQFHPTKWHSFRQIGNSVSPIVGEHILTSIYRCL